MRVKCVRRLLREHYVPLPPYVLFYFAMLRLLADGPIFNGSYVVQHRGISRAPGSKLPFPLSLRDNGGLVS